MWFSGFLLHPRGFSLKLRDTLMTLTIKPLVGCVTALLGSPVTGRRSVFRREDANRADNSQTERRRSRRLRRIVALLFNFVSFRFVSGNLDFNLRLVTSVYGASWRRKDVLDVPDASGPLPFWTSLNRTEEAKGHNGVLILYQGNARGSTTLVEISWVPASTWARLGIWNLLEMYVRALPH
jgi:hypothetical protein